VLKNEEKKSGGEERKWERERKKACKVIKSNTFVFISHHHGEDK